jgi:hypothetical protein
MAGLEYYLLYKFFSDIPVKCDTLYAWSIIKLFIGYFAFLAESSNKILWWY